LSRLTTNPAIALGLGQLVGLLGWIDPLFIPLAVLGPVVTGAVASARGTAYSWTAVLWFSAGINMAWTDWLFNHEDVAFHLALAVAMPILAALGYLAVKVVAPSRRNA
jgi:hypothetical protein